jgi:AsmA protein
MSRRVVLLIALLSLAVLGAAAAPWPLTDGELAKAVSAHVKDRYGIDLEVEGDSTFAILPIPRVKFENVTLALPQDTLRAEKATLRGELRLLPLILGRVELSDLALSNARVTGSLQALRAQLGADLLRNRPDAAYARRLVVTGSSLRWSDAKDADLDDVNLVATWAGKDEPLNAEGSAVWRDEKVLVRHASLYPDLLAASRLSPVSLSVVTNHGQMDVTGEAVLGEDPQITGESAIKTASVRDFSRWSGIALPLGPLVERLSVKGDFSMHSRRLTWPSVAVALGQDKLEGTVAVRFDDGPATISGTLAADRLNLTDLFGPFAETRTPSGAWSGDPLDLRHLTGSNLDLRLSASTATVGRLRLEDMAANVMVRSGQIEATIGRADFHDGTLKGRLSLNALDDKVEFKSQGTFAGVDMATFFEAVNEPRWMTGSAGGQFQFEGTGRDVADLVRDAQGHSSVTVKDGELVGISLQNTLKQMERSPLLASLSLKGGRTPFDQAQAQVTMKGGIGQIVEGQMSAAGLQANVEGRVLLEDRTLDLTANVSSGAASARSPVLAFRIDGGWDSIVVTPDARSMIERSGAAKPLFAPDRPPSGRTMPAEASAH